MRNIFASALLAAAVNGAAFAQQAADTVRVDPIVVTATRVPIALSKVTASVSVIDGKALRAAGVRTVEEALRSISGATVVQSGSYGATTALFLRGGESDYVQVLVDGMQINSPGEQYNWSNLGIENVERIEVVRGPASVLYGSDAVAGVIQIITRRGVGKTHGNAALLVGRGEKVGAQASGSFDNGSFQAEIVSGRSNAGYSLGVSHFATEGAYAFNNQHRNSALTGHASAAMAGLDLGGTIRYSRGRFHYPTDGSGTLSDRNQYSEANSFALGVDASKHLGDRLQAKLSLSHNQNDDLINDKADDAADTIGFFRFTSDQRYKRSDADFRLDYRYAGTSTLTLGAAIESQSSRASSTSSFGDAPETTDKRGNRAAYAQWLGDFSRLTVQLGARAEDNDEFGSFATYRGGVSARVSPILRVRASAGTAFKEPRFFEQFASGFVRGNPDLEPETSRSVEAGVVGTRGGVTVMASYFAQKFRNLIQYIGAPARPTDPNYMNVAAAKASGFEMEGSGVAGPASVSIGYTFLDTRVTNDGDGADPSFAAGEQLIRRPRHSGSVRLSSTIERTTLALTTNYVGERDDLDFATFPAARVRLPAYVRVDLAAQQRITSTASASLKIENATGRAYEEVYKYPARRLVVYVGAQLTF